MKQTGLHLYSSIRPEFKRQLLIRGSALAVLGGGLLLLSAIFVPVTVMSYIGLPLLFLCGGLIIRGLVPYRRLARLEVKPHELMVHGDHYLHYATEGRPLIRVALSEIERINYCDEELGHYGILIDLKAGGQEKIEPLRQGLIVKKYIQEMRRRYACDLFFPFFTQRSYRQLTSLIAEYRAS